MTDNADVEWLRKWEPSRQEAELWIDPVRRASIIAHIDLLEAEANSWRAECVGDRLKALADRRPTVHEIAAQIMAALIAFDPKKQGEKWESIAAESYRGAGG